MPITSMRQIKCMIHPNYYVTCSYPLNPVLGISSLQVGLPSHVIYLLMGLSPIPLEVLHTFSLAKALVNGSARLSPDLTKSIVTEPSEINSLTVLCLRHICRDFPL